MGFSTESLLLFASVIIFISIFVSKAGSKFGIPTLLLFQLVGMAFGSDGLGIQFNSMESAQALGIVALNIILFSGGMDTKYSKIKPIILPGILLATIGVLLTALLNGIFIYLLSGSAVFAVSLSFPTSILLASTMSSTDSASVFNVLRSQKMGLQNNLRPMLELESGSNDPVAYMLTIAMIGIINSGQEVLIWNILQKFIFQICIGSICGFVFGKFAVWVVNKIKLANTSLYPILVLCFVFFIFSMTDMLQGNGYLAVYMSGVIVGNHPLVKKLETNTFLDGLTWLFQIVMFLMLGLLVNPHEMLTLAPFALLVGVFMIVFARPISVFITLLPFRKISVKSKCFISWVISRGIVFNTLSGSVNILFASMVLSGATVHYDYSNYVPKCGDFVFYSYDTNKMGHTAITDGNGNYIHANYAYAVKERADNSVYRMKDGLTYYPVCYVSPRYQNSGTVTASGDTKPPEITGYEATNVTTAGFTVSLSATDNVGLSRATFAVWASANGQDDITLAAGVLNGSTFSYTVNTADHGGAYGDYNVEITVYDALGNSAVLTDYIIYVPPDDSEPPVISDVTTSEVTAEGFTVSCKVTDNTSVRRVLFAAWTAENGADDLVWTEGTLAADGTASCRILAAEHGNAFGEYYAQIYAYDGANNAGFNDELSVRVPSPDAEGPLITNVRLTEVTDTGFLLTGSVTDDSGVQNADVAVWTHTAAGDELVQCRAAINGAMLSCPVLTANHAGESISHTVKLTVYDKEGNFSTYETTYTPAVLTLTRGDPDGDGAVTAADALLVLRASAHVGTLSEAQRRVADLNGDGLVDGRDARLMQRVAEGVQVLPAA